MNSNRVFLYKPEPKTKRLLGYGQPTVLFLGAIFCLSVALVFNQKVWAGVPAPGGFCYDFNPDRRACERQANRDECLSINGCTLGYLASCVGVPVSCQSLYSADRCREQLCAWEDLAKRQTYGLTSNGAIGNYVEGDEWSDGWRVAEAFTVGGQQFLFVAREHGLEGRTYRVNVDGTLGERVQTWNLPRGTPTVETYTVGGKTYLAALWGKTFNVYQIAPDGKAVGRRKIWSGFFDTLKSYTIGGQVYLLFLREHDGLVFIKRVGADGFPTTTVRSYDWSSGWSSVETYNVGNSVYLFLLKRGNGLVHIHRMNSDGSVGGRVFKNKWSRGWATAESYIVAGQPHLFLLKLGGRIHMHRINSNGTVGRMVYNGAFAHGWSCVEPLYVGGRSYILFSK